MPRFNPIWGCSRVSEACASCYAEALAKRYGHNVWGKNGARRTFGEKHWNGPVQWNKKAEAAGEPRLVFCASMADVFEDHPVWETERPKLWDLISHTPWLTWQLLTKRPENISSMVPDAWYAPGAWPVNVWVGTTVETQRWADVRIPLLSKVPAPVRFVSCEPLLGHLNLSDHLEYQGSLGANWVIAGGESGPKARPSHPNWFRNLRDTCAAMGVPFLFKQHGEWMPSPLGRDERGGTSEVWVAPDGQVMPWGSLPVAGATPMKRVGKKAAGWVLDGRTHDEIPERKVAWSQ